VRPAKNQSNNYTPKHTHTHIGFTAKWCNLSTTPLPLSLPLRTTLAVLFACPMWEKNVSRNSSRKMLWGLQLIRIAMKWWKFVVCSCCCCRLSAQQQQQQQHAVASSKLPRSCGNFCQSIDEFWLTKETKQIWIDKQQQLLEQLKQPKAVTHNQYTHPHTHPYTWERQGICNKNPKEKKARNFSFCPLIEILGKLVNQNWPKFSRAHRLTVSQKIKIKKRNEQMEIVFSAYLLKKFFLLLPSLTDKNIASINIYK